MCACPRSRALIHHPVLDRTVEVPARAVRVYERSGWQLVGDDAPPDPDPDPDPDPEIDELDDAIDAAELDQFAGEPADDPSPSPGEFTESPYQEA